MSLLESELDLKKIPAGFSEGTHPRAAAGACWPQVRLFIWDSGLCVCQAEQLTASSGAAALHGGRVLLFLHLLRLPRTTEMPRSGSREQESNQQTRVKSQARCFLTLAPPSLVWSAGDWGWERHREPESALSSPGVMTLQQQQQRGELFAQSLRGFFTLCSTRFLPVTVLF